jgi:hypothetical protein
VSLVKHNNNSISAVTSMASLTTGSMVLISEQTASSSASIEFTTGIDSTYPIYKFEFININPSLSGYRFEFQGSTNSGSSYGVTMTTTQFLARHNENDAATNLVYAAGADIAQGTSYQGLSNDLNNGSDESCSGHLILFNPSSNTYVKHFISRASSVHTTPASDDVFSAGYFNTTSAINAIQFRIGSGNFDGTIKLYGIKDS